MSIKNTIAKIIRSDFKQMQGSRSVEETDTLLCHTLSEHFLKADLPLGDQIKVSQPTCPHAVSRQGVLMGKKRKPHGFMGPLQSLQQCIAGAGFQRGPVPLWLLVGAETGLGPQWVDGGDYPKGSELTCLPVGPAACREILKERHELVAVSTCYVCSSISWQMLSVKLLPGHG